MGKSNGYFRKKSKQRKTFDLLYILIPAMLIWVIDIHIPDLTLVPISLRTVRILAAILMLIGIIIFCIKISKPLLRKRKYLKSGLYAIDKMTGTEFELCIKYHFLRLGYRVDLTPASHDFGADLILRKDGEITVVQAKRYKEKVGIKAIQEIIGAVAYYHADKGYVITNQYCTKSAIELAKKSNIDIWDRNSLIHKLKIKNR